MTEPKPMQEIHRIQEAIYEEDKKRSAAEKLTALHAEAEKARATFNLKVSDYKPPRLRKSG